MYILKKQKYPIKNTRKFKLLMQNYSVLMSVYKKENSIYLREAINSILKQTILPTEIVIIKVCKLTKEL